MEMLSKLNKQVYIVLFFFFCTVCFKAQTLEELQKKYPSDQEVNLKQSTTVKIIVDKDKLKITSDNYEESVLLKDDINSSKASGNVYFSEFRKLDKLDAYSLVPLADGKTKKLPALNYRIKPDKNSRSFHDDSRIKEFDFPQLGKGVKKITNYTISYQDPHMLSGELFLDGIPTEQQEFKVITDNTVDLGYKVFNDSDNKIKFSKEVKGVQTIYTWTATNVEKYAYEVKSPAPFYYVPFVEVYVKSYQDKKGNTVNVLNSLDDLYQLYRTFVKDIYKTKNPELEKTVDSIKAKSASEYDQVRNVYYWVKDNIKYIAFEEGYGGLIPREAGDVYNKRYGDCKDMASIIYTMLHYAGVENVYLAWVGSRERPFSYHDVPTMVVDDHMIAIYKSNGKNYFLDATSKETPMEYPTEFIQGKECLVSLGPDSYEIIKVPVVPAEDNKVDEKINLTIQDNKLKGKGTVLYYGYSKNDVLYRLYDTRGFEMTAKLKAILEKGSNKFFLESHEIENKDEKEKPLSINYTFDIDSYLTNVGDEIFINMFLTKNTFDGILSENRKKDYEADHTGVYRGEYTLQIPQGYKVKYIPKDDSFNNDQFSYKIKYTQNNNQLTLNVEVKTNYLILKKSEFPQWNQFINKLTDNYSESVSISKK